MTYLPSLPTDRAQSETVGVVLLTGVVVITVAVIGGLALSGVSSYSSSPVVDIQGEATSQDVQVIHNGGDSLPRSDVDIVTEGSQRARHSLDSYTQRIGSDDTRFERGDSWRRSNAVTGDRLTLIAIHVPSNTILDRENVDVRVTSFARFTYDPRNPTPTSTVDFDASNSKFEGGTVASYEWDFNNGDKTANGATATYSFPDNGDYPVTLTITADDGRTASRTKTVTVYNTNPEASFTYDPSNPDPEQAITFDASGSSDADGTIDKYEWDWDNDGSYDTTGVTATHTYSTEGDKIVTLRVTDDDGSISRESQTVAVGGGDGGFTGATASGLSNTDDSATQQFTFTIDGTLSGGETVTIDLAETGNGASKIDYSGSGAAASQGDATLPDDSTVVYTTPSGGLAAGTQVTVNVDSVNPGKNSDGTYTVTFTRDSTGSSTTADFTVTDESNNGGGKS